MQQRNNRRYYIPFLLFFCFTSPLMLQYYFNFYATACYKVLQMSILTATEAAKLIGVSRQTIHRWRKSGELSYSEKTDQGFLYDPSEVLRVASNKGVTLPTTDKSDKMLHHATPTESGNITPKKIKSRQKYTVTKNPQNVTSNNPQSNGMLQHATDNVTHVLQQKIDDITKENEQSKLKEALAQKEIELLREQIEDIKKDKDRIFSLVEKNTLLLEHVQKENRSLKQQITEVTTETKKKKWWLF